MIYSKKIINQINEDIEKCRNHCEREGSTSLYNEMVSRYTTIDEDFMNGIPSMSKTGRIGLEYDFRPELKCIASKLETLLMINNADSKIDFRLEQLKKIIDAGEMVKKKDFQSGVGYPDHISGPTFYKWISEIKVFSSKYLKTHELYSDIDELIKKKNNWFPNRHEQMIVILETIYEDEGFWKENNDKDKEIKKNNSKNIFIVHGHDDHAKKEVENFIRKLGYNPIILHYQPNSGKTIIEKIEEYTDVCYAIVLYTQCDLGRNKEASIEEEKYRARQNVVFEHGYLMAKLGRKNVNALVKGEVETPGDISGVVYTIMDSNEYWELVIAKEMKAIGLEVDLSKL